MSRPARATHGRVYRAIGADDEVLYVGMSTQLGQRMKEHARRSPWWPLVRRIDTGEPLPIADAFRAECDQIVTLRPRFNQNGGVAQWHGRDASTPADHAVWREQYEAGKTVEDIALDAGLTTGTVRKHLVAAGTEMRRPGQRKGTPSNRPTQTPKAGHDAVVRVVFPGSRGVHRRRGARRAAA